MESEVKNNNAGDLSRKRKNKPAKWALAVFIIGIVILVVGLTVFLINKNSQPSMADVDFLISAGEWQREDQPAVIWNFTEVGKGKLTTDEHLNDYSFIWSLDDNKLKIETTWLYDLNDEFDYKIDQGAKTLTIINPDKNVEVKFKAIERASEDSSTSEN